MVSRIQFFVPLFIEGGSYLDVNDSDASRWTVFFLFLKESSGDKNGTGEYIFVGYSTVYRFFFFRPPTPPVSERKEIELPYENEQFSFDDLPSRARLSQFIILPEFQHQGNGPHLYNSIYKHYYDDPLVHELTVEDPNESFDDMRDICDLAFLRTVPEFNNLCVNSSIQLPKTGPVPRGIVDQKLLEDIRHKVKIVPRQFARLVEMHLMSKLPASVIPGFPTQIRLPPATNQEKKEYRLWKVYTKMRLYRHNADALGEFDLDERLEKLNETLLSVELEYARILLAVERRDKTQNNGKRKADDDGEKSASKKARFADADYGKQ
jgi:histone acetyltransferase 1